MAVIAITPNSIGATTLTRTTMTASDTLAYVPGAGMQLYLANNTAGPLTVTLTGSTAPASYVVPGTGGTTIAPSAGKAIGPIATNTTVELSLDDFQLYLQGVVTLTGGTGITATVLSN